MRFNEIIAESRGVTARAAGDTYVNATNKNDVLTIVDVTAIPTEKPAYANTEELDQSLSAAIPANSKIVYDNNKTSATRAALIATVTNTQNQPEYHVRYIQEIPPAGIHGLWKTIKGYNYSKGVERESLPIKPADILADENYRSATELASTIIAGVNKNTTDQQLVSAIEDAVNMALAGSPGPIKDAAPYFNVLQKYAGEYLGPIGLISGGFTGGDTEKMMQQLGINTLVGSRVKFPQDKAQKLIDSIMQTPDGTEIQVSSKISTGGGAASSLLGVAEQIDDNIQQKYPVATSIIRSFAEKDQVNGPLSVALQLGIINQQDLQALASLDRGSKNVSDLGTENLQKIVNNQGVRLDTPEKQAGYRVFFHVMNAIVNLVVERLNRDNTFVSALQAALNNNQYVQIVTKGRVAGNDIFLDYYTKFPAVFSGKPQLYNKTYMSTGIKGRLGFKLK
jgi:hypothetical protein